MIDGLISPHVQPQMAGVAAKLNHVGLDSKKAGIVAFAIGLAGCFCVGMALYIPGLILLLLSRVGAGIASMDQAITQKQRYALTLADFIVFGAFAFMYSLGMEETSMAAAFVIFSILVMGMAYIGSNDTKGGLVGQSEMILFIIICCVFPPAFPAVCIFFGLLCWVTAALRAFTAYKS